MPIKSQLGNSQNLVAIEAVQESALILKDGSLRQVVMVGGVNFSLRSEQEQNLITGGFQAFLNAIDFPLQVVIHSRKINIQKYLDDLAGRREKEPSPLLQSQISEYIEFIRQFVQENAIMEKSFFVVVPWYPTQVAKATRGFLSSLPFMKKPEKKTGMEQKEEKQFPAGVDIAKELPPLRQRVTQVVEGLSALELDAIVLDDEQLVELFYNLYNPGTVEKEGVVEPAESGNQIS